MYSKCYRSAYVMLFICLANVLSIRLWFATTFVLSVFYFFFVSIGYSKLYSKQTNRYFVSKRLRCIVLDGAYVEYFPNSYFSLFITWASFSLFLPFLTVNHFVNFSQYTVPEKFNNELKLRTH